MAMRIKILNKFWEFKYVYMKKGTGECSDPTKEIRISNRTRGKTELDSIIHECLHASAFDVLDEYFVQEAASDIARLLWKLGYRKVPPEDQ